MITFNEYLNNKHPEFLLDEGFDPIGWVKSIFRIDKLEKRMEDFNKEYIVPNEDLSLEELKEKIKSSPEYKENLNLIKKLDSIETNFKNKQDETNESFSEIVMSSFNGVAAIVKPVLDMVNGYFRTILPGKTGRIVAFMFLPIMVLVPFIAFDLGLIGLYEVFVGAATATQAVRGKIVMLGALIAVWSYIKERFNIGVKL